MEELPQALVDLLGDFSGLVVMVKCEVDDKLDTDVAKQCLSVEGEEPHDAPEVALRDRVG